MHNLAISLVLVAWSLAAQAGVGITDSWARATVAGQDVGAAYMTLNSTSDATLVSATSPVSTSVEIHSMTMDNGIMKMRMLDSLPIPAGKPVKLEPTGLHLMLLGLKKPLKAGDKIEISLTLKDKLGKQEIRKISLPVKADVQKE